MDIKPQWEMKHTCHISHLTSALTTRTQAFTEFERRVWFIHNVNWSRLHWNQSPMFSLVISNTESSQSQPVIQTNTSSKLIKSHIFTAGCENVRFNQFTQCVCMTGWLCDDSVLLMTRLNIGDWFQCNLDQLTLWQHAKLHDIIITITTTLPVQHSQAELMDSLGVKLERRQLITKAVQCVKHSTILQWLQILLLQQQKLHLLTQHNTAKLHQH